MIDWRDTTSDSIEPAARRPKVIYVMGYGRSGSTLLDIMLSNQTGILGGGELIEFSTWTTTNRLCACGAVMAECAFWRRVNQTYVRRLSRTRAPQCGDGRELQSRRGLLRQMLKRKRSRGAAAWSRSEVALFESLAEVGRASAVVDSSKSAAAAAGRALALSRLTGLDVRPILLVRDGRAVTYSCARRKGSPERPQLGHWPFVRGLRGLIGWNMTNALCLLSFRWFRRRPVIVRYENLATQPQRELERLARAVGVDFSEVIERVDRGEALEVRHVLGGNRLRFEGRVTIRPDDGWRDEMSLFWRALCGLAAWPIEICLRQAERRDTAYEGPAANGVVRSTGSADVSRARPVPRSTGFNASGTTGDRPFVLVVGGSDVHMRAELMDALSDRFRFEVLGSGREARMCLETSGHVFHEYDLLRDLSPVRDLMAMMRMTALMRTLAPAIVHAFDTKPTVWGRLAARMAGVPVVIGTIPGLGSVNSPGGRRTPVVKVCLRVLQTLSCSVSHVTILQNPDDYRELVARRVVPTSRADVILGSGIRTDVFDPKRVDPVQRQRIREEVDAKPTTVVVTMVSRVNRSKGVSEFAEAAMRVRSRYADVRFVLVGPDDRDSVDRLSDDEASHIHTSVKWLGARSDIMAILSATDVFVLPSYLREGIPRALLEAASMALPLVTTRSPGCREVVIDGDSGFLVPPRDSAALADAIVRLVEQPALRSTFGSRARRRAIERFDLTLIADQLATLYQRLLSRQLPMPRCCRGTIDQ